MKSFHLGDVLSVTTGKLVGPSGIGGVYEICDHMLRTSHFTHQLPRAAEDARPAIFAQYPELKEVEVPKFGEGVTKEDVLAWVETQVPRYGATLDLEPVSVAEAAKKERGPISELAEMMQSAEKRRSAAPEEGA